MLYTILKFVHVVSMAVWIGGMIMMLLLNRRFIAAGEVAIAQAIGRQGAFLSTRVFLPAVLTTLITGIGMVQVGKLSFTLTWIVWGMVALIVSMIIGAVFTGGAARKLAARAAAGQVTASEMAAAQRRILVFAIINILLLLSTIWAMVAKPS